jgi:hypothetical protein
MPNIKEHRMNVARKMIFIAIGCFACIGAKAQISCGNSSATASKLACLVPYSSHATLQSPTSPTGIAALNATSIFNGPIGSQLSQLPLAASAPGAIILTIHGNPEAYNNLGPVLVDRPDSVGQGRLVLGFSAQQFTFNRLDGNKIGSIPLVYSVSQGSSSLYFAQYVDASVRYNQYVMLATYGFPKKTDISVIVPYTRISMGAAAILPTTYLVSDSGFSPPTRDVTLYVPGSAKGVGDVIISAKHVLWSGGEAGKGSLATGVALRLPTGDALNYLGSGAYGVNLYGLAAYKAKFSPHVKIGYQWNTDSVLSFNYAASAAGLNGNQRLPGGLQSAVGVDYGVSRYLTLSADLLTNEFQNSPSISQVPFSSTVGGAALANPNSPASSCNQANGALTNAANLTALGNLCTVNTVNSTFTEVNFSGGFKWKPFVKHAVILYGNVLIQTTDVGLRSEPSPSVGISYNFSANKWPNWLYRSPDHW